MPADDSVRATETPVVSRSGPLPKQPWFWGLIGLRSRRATWVTRRRLTAVAISGLEATVRVGSVKAFETAANWATSAIFVFGILGALCREIAADLHREAETDAAPPPALV